MQAEQEFSNWISDNYNDLIRLVKRISATKGYRFFDVKLSSEDVLHSAILKILEGNIRYVSVDQNGNIVDEATKKHRLYSLVSKAAISYVIDQSRKADAHNPYKAKKFSLFISVKDGDDSGDDSEFLKSSAQTLESFGIYEIHFSSRKEILDFINKFVNKEKYRQVLFNEFFIGGKSIADIEHDYELPQHAMYTCRKEFCKAFERDIKKELGISMSGYKYFSEAHA